jgi:AbrB family looped-hinge helix DNA binding protein
MEVAKVNAHYQVTIPKSVRQKAKVRKGSYVKVDYRDGTIFIRPVTRAEEKQKLRSIRQAAENKFADVWKDEDDAVWGKLLIGNKTFSQHLDNLNAPKNGRSKIAIFYPPSSILGGI